MPSPHETKLFDVVQRDADYVLFCNGRPYQTPEGDETAHRSPRLLEQLQQECSAATDETPVTMNFFRTCCALNRPDGDTALTHWARLLALDPLLDKAAFDTATAQPDDPRFMLSLAEDHAHLSLFFNGLAGAVKCCNRFLLDFTEGHIDFSHKNPDGLAALLLQAYQAFAAEEKAAVHLLGALHACGILLPMLLIQRRLTSTEYLNALFGLHPPRPPERPRAVNPFAPLLAAPESAPAVLPDWSRPVASFAALRAQVWSVLDAVQSADPIHCNRFDVLQLIRGGESFNTEFKTSLRWNVRTERKDSAIEHASLKTVNAFLNSSGGILLVGVRDDGSIEGLDIDQFPNEDKYALHFWNLIKFTMGQEVSGLIRATFEPVGDRKVFTVRCSPSPQPVFLQQKGQEDEFYVRVGPSSAKLSVKEALHYINARFQNPISA